MLTVAKAPPIKNNSIHDHTDMPYKVRPQIHLHKPPIRIPLREVTLKEDKTDAKHQKPTEDPQSVFLFLEIGGAHEVPVECEPHITEEGKDVASKLEPLLLLILLVARIHCQHAIR